jgi:opacity protein-like surface antigen
MRSKLVVAALFILSTLPMAAQVSPSAKINGIPLSVGGGISDYNLDFGPSRRMIGASAWVDYRIWHGLGVEAEGTSIFAAKPDSLTRMKQDTIKGGLIYKYHPVFHLVPYAKGLYGLGSIDFPSHNPFYTHDTFSMMAVGGGVEYRLWKNVYLRGDYEYQWWDHFLGHHTLTPSGATIGATYYLRSTHRHF